MHNNRGFSLIELMVTLAIVAILITAAAPSFRSLLVGSDIQAESDAAKQLLKLARSEAIKRGAPVVVTAQGNDWGANWFLFAEKAPANNTYDGTDTIIYEKDSPAIPINIIVAETTSWISFSSNGLVTTNGANTLYFCDPANELDGRSLQFSRAGQISTQDITAGSALCN